MKWKIKKELGKWEQYNSFITSSCHIVWKEETLIFLQLREGKYKLNGKVSFTACLFRLELIADSVCCALKTLLKVKILWVENGHGSSSEFSFSKIFMRNFTKKMLEVKKKVHLSRVKFLKDF